MIQCDSVQISNEMRFLLDFCISSPTNSPPPDVRALDQDRLQSLTEWHRVYPTLVANVKRAGLYDERNPFFSRMNYLTNKNALHTMKLVREAGAVFGELRAAGVDALLLKGTVLAMDAYHNPSMRVMKDLDIMVKRQDVDKAARVLLGRQYTGLYQDYMRSEKKMRTAMSVSHDIIFRNPDGIEIELHWRVHLARDETWFHDCARRTVSLGGSEVTAMALEDQALYLIFHGSEHNYFRLKWLLDIAELMRKRAFEWEGVVRKAADKELLPCVLGCWLLLYTLWPDAIPAVETAAASVRYDESDGAWRVSFPENSIFTPDIQALGVDFYRSALDNFTVAHSGPPASKGYARRARSFLSGTPSLPAMLRPKPVDFERFDFDDRFFFLYYLARPWYKLYRLIRPESEEK